jgi:hypothetical protein
MPDSPLEVIETYYHAVPRSVARAENIGPFTLFVNSGSGWPYYARPSLGAHQFSVAEVQNVRARQHELKIPPRRARAVSWPIERTFQEDFRRCRISARGLQLH